MVVIQAFKSWALAALLMLVAVGGNLAVPSTAVAQDAAAPAAAVSEEAAPAAEATAEEGAEAPSSEAVENPYGIGALWKQGDFVSKGVLIILLLMSGSTWYVMIVKIYEQSKVMKQASQATGFWKASSVAQGLSGLPEGTPFWYIADRGVSASNHHEGTMVEQIDLSSWITMSVNRAVEEIQSRLQGGLAVLATVGSTSPFVGLFGTVWGIYHALTAIGISGQASIDKVAGPVGEALIMTAIGLAVAVPAVLGYNWLVRRNKAAMEQIRAFSSDLHSVLLSGTRVGDKKAA